MPSIFCILKFLLIHSHRFVAVVIQILIPFGYNNFVVVVVFVDKLFV